MSHKRRNVKGFDRWSLIHSPAVMRGMGGHPTFYYMFLYVHFDLEILFTPTTDKINILNIDLPEVVRRNTNE